MRVLVSRDAHEGAELNAVPRAASALNGELLVH